MIVIEKGTTFISGYGQEGEDRGFLTATRDLYAYDVILASDFIDQDGNHPTPGEVVPGYIMRYVHDRFQED